MANTYCLCFNSILTECNLPYIQVNFDTCIHPDDALPTVSLKCKNIIIRFSPLNILTAATQGDLCDPLSITATINMTLIASYGVPFTFSWSAAADTLNSTDDSRIIQLINTPANQTYINLPKLTLLDKTTYEFTLTITNTFGSTMTESISIISSLNNRSTDCIGCLEGFFKYNNSCFLSCPTEPELCLFEKDGSCISKHRPLCFRVN